MILNRTIYYVYSVLRGRPNLSGVRVGLSLTVDQGDVDESLSVQQSHVSSTLWGLWLFSLVDLWSLRLNLTSTSQGTVNLTLK